MKDEPWLSKIIQHAREVWEHGEGSAIFKVTKENGIKQWKAEITKVDRSVQSENIPP